MQTLSTPKLNDAHERERALSPTESFIVQAPAGSGKTELLTQRYLVLLGYAKQPEEILAITFTKKSAAEMRARIIKALKNAATFPEPTLAHEKKTWTLAKEVLQQDLIYHWDLLENPNRLQIQTIDSFNASLTRQLPLLANFGAPLDIVDDATPLYRKAVQEFLTYLEENVSFAASIEKLLLHLDNDLSKVETLLVNMLKRRDQWLPYIAMNTENPHLRSTLETHLRNISADVFSEMERTFPVEYANELLEIVQFAGTHIQQLDSPLVTLKNWTQLPRFALENKQEWLTLATLLFTKTKPYSWRKNLTVNEGFPAGSSTKNPDEKQRYTEFKTRAKQLIDVLSEQTEFYFAFTKLLTIPSSIYEDAQWETLYALHDILKILVAQLKIVFQEESQIDYIENSQAALTSLGTCDMPTDLTLALDYKIQHILIDEFQDTSQNQYRLLDKLILGWEPNDGRTLFVVGDPMQSIYRFREAEVGLFIRARKKGIGHLPLVPLTLSVNFRSCATVVDWVNQHFQDIFPTIEDMTHGAVSYTPSIACEANKIIQGKVQLHPFLNANEKLEADAIIDLIQSIRLNTPEKKIAILVRSRSHLNSILSALKTARLPFQALDIEPLVAKPVIQDLLALTRALLHPGDRIAWLAILRAPWCGLSLNDLLILSKDKNKFIVWDSLKVEENLKLLSREGQHHLKRILPILEIALSERRRFPLRQWIEYTWLQVGGPACLTEHSDLHDAEAFFELLEKVDEGNTVHFKKLNDALVKLYASPQVAEDHFLQIMTIHNAKGLEFDIVILPGLERKARHDEKQLLQWMERPRENDTSDLILAPIHASDEESDSIFTYINEQQKIKSSHENGRLLYVAATRAKEQLHLFFNLESKENQELKKPASNSLLEKLWPSIEKAVEEELLNRAPSENEKVSNEIKPILIKRLLTSWNNPQFYDYFSLESGFHQKESGFLLPNHNPRYVGVLIHQILQHISLSGPKWWTDRTTTQQNNYITNHFYQLGMKTKDSEHAIQQVLKAIHNTLNDTRGQWILKSHQEAESEKPLSLWMGNEIKDCVIDRTFVDQNIRWIIDYKTSVCGEVSLNEFLINERKKYEAQLQCYAAAFREIDQRPIRLGLYFPLIPAWYEWEEQQIPL